MSKSLRLVLGILTVVTLGLAACQPSASAAGPKTAMLDQLVNEVDARTSAAGSFAPIVSGFTIRAGGQIQTGPASGVRMNFDDGTIVRVSEQTKFTLTGTDGTGTAKATLDFGKLWVSLASGKLEVDTPVGVASVRGSYAVFEYTPGQDPNNPEDDVLTVSCLEGTCEAQNETLNLDLGNLEQVVITSHGKKAEKLTLHDYDVQQFLAVNPESGGVVATLTAAPPKNENGNTITGPARATMNEYDRATRDALRATEGKGPQGTPGPKAEKTPGAPGNGTGNSNGSGTDSGNSNGNSDGSGGGGGGGKKP
jgi:hypothetical protein